MKITVERKESTCSIDDTDSEETIEDFYNMAIRAALGCGYAPLLVAAWFRVEEE